MGSEPADNRLPTQEGNQIGICEDISMPDQPHFTAQCNVVKDNAENSDFFFSFPPAKCHNSFKPVPSTSSETVDKKHKKSILKVNNQPGICGYQ